MNIALITPNFPPENGACASRIHFMAKGLAQAGHRVEVVTAIPNYPVGRIFEGYRGRCFVREQDGPLRIHRYWMYPSHSARLFFRVLSMISLSVSVLFSFFALRRFRPDVLIVQSPPLLLAVSAWLLAKACRARFVLNISDLWPQALADLGAISPKGQLYALLSGLESWLYTKAQLCLGQSAEIIAHIEQKHPAANTLLYRTGVNCALFYPNPAPRQHPAQPLRLVYAGLLGIAQGLAELCKAVDFRALGAELHIYGQGYERRLLEEWLRQHPDRGIFLHPAVAYTQVPGILRQYDAALIPQKNRLLGTVPSKIYEAMASGLPIVQSGAGESADIVLQSGAGLSVFPGDYAALSREIVKLQQMSPEERNAMSEKGRATAVKHFDRKNLLLALSQKLEHL